MDLIEYSPYSHIKIDDPVIFWESDMHLHRGHFAGIDDAGRPMTYRWQDQLVIPWQCMVQIRMQERSSSKWK
jgi:hypothetical protein